MKRFLQSLMVACLSFAMVGCYEDSTGPEVPVIGSLTLSQEQMTVGAEGGEYSVDITTEYDYETNVNVDWITVSGGSCGTECCTLNFIVAKNNSGAEREGFITFFCDDYNLSATLTVVQEVGEKMPNNQIWYTSTDGVVVTPYATDVFGANIVSNTYENGKGIITFDGDVTLIGDYAFYNCTSLTSITIPDSVTEIEEGAFSYCYSLASITIPNSVTSVGFTAFAYCSSMTSVTIPDSINSIGYSAFRGCTSLKSITIPDSVTSIGDVAFSDCSSLTSVTIPDSVTSIGEGAFQICTSLTSVTIPNSVTSVGYAAFCYCSSLTSVTIPDSVTSIGSAAFAYCSSLTAFYGKFASADNRCLIVDGVLHSFAPAGLTQYTIPNSVTSIGDWAFYECRSLTSITIPDSVTSIGSATFCYCSSLTSVTIPGSVTSIGDYAFAWCTSLTSVTIPDSVTSIGGYAFSDCNSLTSVTIPNSVTSIGWYAFDSCTSLTSVTIPNSVTSIGYCAFSSCTSLKYVYCKPTTPPTGNYNMFYNNASGRKIYVPRNSVEAYKSAQYWSDYADYIVGFDF